MRPRPTRRSAPPSGVAGALEGSERTRVSLLSLPLVVLLSLFFNPMTLVFGWVEIAILGLMVLVFNYIAHDGESNWLEGLQLVVLYVMAAIVIFVLPSAAFSG